MLKKTAMILAAGRGERMRHLTDNCPKPLLLVGGKALIVWHLEKLQAAGFSRVVINHAYLGAAIEAYLGDGSRFGVEIFYSPEPMGALETAGGIARALPLLQAGNQDQSADFLVVNADVFCDLDFKVFFDRFLALKATGTFSESAAASGAFLLMVDNPDHHQAGDFSLEGGRITAARPEKSLTYSGIGIFAPDFFKAVIPDTEAKLRPLFEGAIKEKLLFGTRYDGFWCDVGTPERLDFIQQYGKMQGWF